MKRIICTLLMILSVFVGQSQIGIFKQVIADTLKAKDYRFQQLPNYSVYNALQNITAGDENLSTPPGNTAARPTVPAGKYILRYNTDSAALEIGDPSQVWKTIGMSSIQTFDTSSITNFGLKVRSTLSGTSPILYNGVTGNISIQQSNSSQAGYLSQADWIAFNAKLPDPGSNGLVARTALGTTASRQLVAASNNISLVNANGVSGNPSIDVNDTLVLAQVQLTQVPGVATYADSVLVLNRTTNMLEVKPGSGGSNLSNASLTADAAYTHNWNNNQLVIDSIASSFLFRAGGIGNTGTVRKEFSISWPGNSFANQFDQYNLWSAIRKSDNSADSLRLGLLSEGTGVLSMGYYDVANSSNNTFISYSSTAGLINITAKDSIWIKGATPAATADSILGVLDRLDGRGRMVKIPYGATQPSWQQTLNVSNVHSSALVYDTAMVGNPVEKLWHKYEKLVKTDTATTAFYDWQFAGSNNGSFNEVRMFGWNLNAGGGQQEAGKPALGESWESNYQINPAYPSASDRLVEKHEIYVTPGGTQHRIGSYTINTNTGTISLYHTIGSFSLHNVSTHTPYFSVLGTSNNTQQTFINSSNQSSYFSTNVNFNQDASTAAFTLSAGASGRPVNLYNLSGFTQAALPNTVFSRNGYDGTQIQFNGATTGALARWVSDSSQTMISTFTNVAMRFMPNTAQALDLRSTRVNIYQPTGIGTGVSTPIAQLDVRNSALNQTIYCENTKAAGKAGIFTTVNAGGSNTGLSVNASGGTDNKGINFEASMGAGDWNIYSSNASKTYLAGKVQLGTTSDQARKLYINGSIGANKDSIPIITTIGSRYLLAQDTAAGSSLGQFMRILPSDLGLSGTTIYSGDGTLSADRTVSTGGFTTTWTGANDNETAFTVANTGTTNASAFAATATGTTSIAISGTSTQYIGILGTSTSNNGIQGQSTSGTGVVGTSSSGVAFRGQINPSANNAIANVSSFLVTSSSGAGANGLGAAIQYELETATNGTSQVAGSTAFVWSDATNATRSARYDIYTVDNATLGRKATLSSGGQWTWDTYGSATHTGTPSGSLQTTSAGAIIEGPVLEAGFYTPTLTAVTNTSSPLLDGARYTRVGNIVTFSLRFAVTTSSGSSASSIRVTLPVGSSFSNVNQAAGTCSGSLGYVEADAANDELVVGWISGSGGSETIVVTGQYSVF